MPRSVSVASASSGDELREMLFAAAGREAENLRRRADGEQGRAIVDAAVGQQLRGRLLADIERRRLARPRDSPCCG